MDGVAVGLKKRGSIKLKVVEGGIDRAFLGWKLGPGGAAVEKKVDG